jgi:nicotinate-nucleotide adenylyltransferase
LQLVHLVVVGRPGTAPPASGEVAELCRLHATAAPALHQRRFGCVHLTEVTQLEISASALRRSIAAGMDPRYLVPDAVRSIISETRCYA